MRYQLWTALQPPSLTGGWPALGNCSKDEVWVDYFCSFQPEQQNGEGLFLLTQLWWWIASPLTRLHLQKSWCLHKLSHPLRSGWKAWECTISPILLTNKLTPSCNAVRKHWEQTQLTSTYDQQHPIFCLLGGMIFQYFSNASLLQLQQEASSSHVPPHTSTSLLFTWARQVTHFESVCTCNRLRHATHNFSSYCWSVKGRSFLTFVILFLYLGFAFYMRGTLGILQGL